MLKLSNIDKIFLFFVALTLFVAVPEYIYMNNHSLAARKEATLNALLRTERTLQEARAIINEDEDFKTTDGVFSPLIQLGVIIMTLFIFGTCFSVFMLQFTGLIGEARIYKYLLMGICVFFFWVIVAEVIIFLWKILL